MTSDIREHFLALEEGARKQGFINASLVRPFIEPSPAFFQPILAQLEGQSHKELSLAGKLVNKPIESRGLQSVRKLIVEYLERQGIKTIEDNILLTNGATGALFLTLFYLYLTKKGPCSVASFIPFYNPYKGIVESVGGKFVGISMENFKITPKVMIDLHSKKPDVLIVTDPHNPTGRKYTQEEIDLIAAFAEESHTSIIIDEAYAEYCSTFGVFQKPINLFRARSFGKSVLAAPNVRAGFLVCPTPDTCRRISGLMQGSSGSLALHTQLLMENALKQELVNTEEQKLWRLRFNSKKDKRLRYIKELQVSYPQLEIVSNDIGLFCLVKLNSSLSDIEICKQAISKNVGVLPGHIFGLDASLGYVRVSLGTDFKFIPKIFQVLNEIQSVEL